MKSSITVSLVPEARGGPFVFWEDLEGACRSAAELGFAGIEIFPPSAEVLNEVKAGETARRHGLKVAALGSGAGWLKHKLSLSDPRPENRREAIEFVGGLIDVAGDLEAPVIIGSMQGKAEAPSSRDEALKLLGDSLLQLSARAHARQVLILYEFLNRYETNLLNRVADVLSFLRPLKAPRVKVLADLFHMNIEESSIPAALEDLGDLLGHVHFVDSNRRAAGYGHTDFPPIMAALREIHYEGYLSAEALPYPSSQAAAGQTMLAFREWAV